MLTEAIVLAGGFGTRLQSVVKDIPKSMAPICDKPFLEYQLLYLKHYGIKKVYLSVGYKKEVIIDHFGDEFQGLKITYITEDEPLGTGGGILKALKETTSDNVLVCNGDTMFELDLLEYYDLFQKNGEKIALALKPMSSYDRYGSVFVNEQKEITGFQEKKKTEKGLISGGVYIMNRKIVLDEHMPEKFSIEKDFLEKKYTEIKMFGYISDTYFLDIGIPSDYDKAQLEFKRFKY